MCIASFCSMADTKHTPLPSPCFAEWSRRVGGQRSPKRQTGWSQKWLHNWKNLSSHRLWIYSSRTAFKHFSTTSNSSTALCSKWLVCSMFPSPERITLPATCWETLCGFHSSEAKHLWLTTVNGLGFKNGNLIIFFCGFIYHFVAHWQECNNTKAGFWAGGGTGQYPICILVYANGTMRTNRQCSAAEAWKLLCIFNHTNTLTLWSSEASSRERLTDN